MSMLGIHPSAMFAVAFPLTLLFRTWATSLATILLAGQLTDEVVEQGHARLAGVQSA